MSLRNIKEIVVVRIQLDEGESRNSTYEREIDKHIHSKGQRKERSRTEIK